MNPIVERGALNYNRHGQLALNQVFLGWLIGGLGAEVTVSLSPLLAPLKRMRLE